MAQYRCSLTCRPVHFVYFRENSNGDFNNVELSSVFQFSDEAQGLKYLNRVNSRKKQMASFSCVQPSLTESSSGGHLRNVFSHVATHLLSMFSHVAAHLLSTFSHVAAHLFSTFSHVAAHY